MVEVEMPLQLCSTPVAIHSPKSKKDAIGVTIHLLKPSPSDEGTFQKFHPKIAGKTPAFDTRYPWSRNLVSEKQVVVIHLTAPTAQQLIRKPISRHSRDLLDGRERTW